MSELAAGGTWRWQEYFEEAVDETGCRYGVDDLAGDPDVKRLTRGEVLLLEHDPDERVLRVSHRAEQLLGSRCIRRGSHRVSSPDGGEDGQLWVLTRVGKTGETVLMINWRC